MLAMQGCTSYAGIATVAHPFTGQVLPLLGGPEGRGLVVQGVAFINGEEHLDAAALVYAINGEERSREGKDEGETVLTLPALSEAP